MRFTVILTPDTEDGGFTAECPVIPGCISEGETVEEALGNIKQAIEGCLESLAARQESLPSDGAVIVATVEADVPVGVNLMAPLPSVNWRETVRAFEKAGWRHDRTRSSHYILVRPNRPGLLSVPMHDPIRRGTLRKLIREAGLTVDEFVDLLK